QAALEAHNQSEHFQTFFKEVETYLLEAPKIEVATIK
ncbi:antibiotic biosynthesis monooxygenase, partial [Mesorhizobium sp. M8A.F.Ca.ET.208.01.1.1]